MDVAFFLKASPLLKGFTDDGIKIIQAATSARQIAAGVPIVVEQMQGESLFIIAEGAVDLYVTRGGVEHKLAILNAPDHFGELSLLAAGQRRISARAQTNTTVLEISRRDFLSLQKQRPQACLKLMINICELFAMRAQDAGGALANVLA
jgi:CRP/FNR family cyclic AMP-dependent transcriptional regulator